MKVWRQFFIPPLSADFGRSIFRGVKRGSVRGKFLNNPINKWFLMKKFPFSRLIDFNRAEYKKKKFSVGEKCEREKNKYGCRRKTLVKKIYGTKKGKNFLCEKKMFSLSILCKSFSLSPCVFGCVVGERTQTMNYAFDVRKKSWRNKGFSMPFMRKNLFSFPVSRFVVCFLIAAIISKICLQTKLKTWSAWKILSVATEKPQILHAMFPHPLISISQTKRNMEKVNYIQR